MIYDTVQLDGNGSSDADGDTLTFKWSFVYKPDGSSATLSDSEAVKPSFKIDVAGTYTLQLIVNDGTDNSTGLDTAGDNPEANWWDPGWSARMPIYFANTAIV